MSENHAYDPLQPHSHDPNPDPPSADATLQVVLPDGRQQHLTVSDLQTLPQTAVDGCLIVSTGHGTSGPFTFSGVTLKNFAAAIIDQPWSQLEVVSADGFGNRVTYQECQRPDPAGPILLALARDGQTLTRRQGLVRLIVPNEKDDALRQVKWVAVIRVRA